MRYTSLCLVVCSLLWACNGGGPTAPTSSTTTAPPSPSFQIDVLITVYKTSVSGAFWSRGQTTNESIGRILLGVEELGSVVGSTNLNNEGGREALQAAIDRVRAQFGDSDYTAAFGETKANLERYLNDADSDGWSIDGRNGQGKDWPYDSNGNDPDGWTGQIIVKISRLN